MSRQPSLKVDALDLSARTPFLQILICQNLRNNLQHPNEFLRGATLRFLCRIKEEEILEPLIPSILACLEHRNATVRKNAVLAINSLVKLNKGEHLLQDSSELIEKACLPRLISLCLSVQCSAVQAPSPCLVGGTVPGGGHIRWLLDNGGSMQPRNAS